MEVAKRENFVSSASQGDIGQLGFFFYTVEAMCPASRMRAKRGGSHSPVDTGLVTNAGPSLFPPASLCSQDTQAEVISLPFIKVSPWSFFANNLGRVQRALA